MHSKFSFVTVVSRANGSTAVTLAKAALSLCELLSLSADFKGILLVFLTDGEGITSEVESTPLVLDVKAIGPSLISPATSIIYRTSNRANKSFLRCLISINSRNCHNICNAYVLIAQWFKFLCTVYTRLINSFLVEICPILFPLLFWLSSPNNMVVVLYLLSIMNAFYFATIVCSTRTSSNQQHHLPMDTFPDVTNLYSFNHFLSISINIWNQYF